MKRVSLLISIFFFFSTLVAQYDVDLKMYDFKEIPNLSEKEDARYRMKVLLLCITIVYLTIVMKMIKLNYGNVII